MKNIPYKFDIRLGHYVYIGNALNEGEDTGDGTTNPENNQQANTQVKPSVVNLKSEEVVQLEADKAAKIKSYQTDLDAKKDIIRQKEAKLAQAANDESINQTLLNAMQKEILQAQYDLMEKEFELKNLIHDFDKKIFQAKEKLVESVQRQQLPLKYRNLNESNIHNAKIYIDTLVGKEDSDAPIKGMCDFKRAFKKSQLLYGKDQTGYFAVCVDKQDFEKMTNTLEEAGYLKSTIIDVLMPQLFDRTDMVK